MYLYKIPNAGREQPEWVRNSLRKLNEKYDMRRSWIWDWNDTYERKITVQDGTACIVFNDEADYTWFVLRYS